MIYADIPRKIFGKNEDDDSEAEVASELASELYYDERGDAEVVDSQVAEFIDY